MAFTFTARDSGYYKVYVDGVLASQHTAEREACESCTLQLELDPSAQVWYEHQYRVDVVASAQAPSQGAYSDAFSEAYS